MQHFFLPVVIHLCIWLLFAAVDYLFYWLIIYVNKHLQELPDLEIHLRLSQQKNSLNVGMNENIAKNDLLKISLFKNSCVPQPELHLSMTWLQLGTITFFLIIFGLSSGLLTQLKILVSNSFYPDVEMKRIQYLHSKLLKKRTKIQQKAVKNVFARTVNFWFPILRARETVRKKDKAALNDNMV